MSSLLSFWCVFSLCGGFVCIGMSDGSCCYLFVCCVVMMGVVGKNSSSLGLSEATSRCDPLPSAAGIKCEYNGQGEYSY
jgi:hypothetical protein